MRLRGPSHSGITVSLSLKEMFQNAPVHTHAHTHTHICMYTPHTQSAHYSKTVVDYFIPNRKLSELFLDVRGDGTGSDNFLTFAKVRFPPKLLHLPKNTTHKKNILHYTISLTQ
jgi:hypothetical protein